MASVSARPAGDKDWQFKVTMDTVRINAGLAIGAVRKSFLSGIGKAIFGKMPTPMPAAFSFSGYPSRPGTMRRSRESPAG
jgi:hypothetical protein